MILYLFSEVQYQTLRKLMGALYKHCDKKMTGDEARDWANYLDAILDDPLTLDEDDLDDLI